MPTILSPRCTAALFALSLSACANPALEQQAAGGQSVRAAIAAQIISPESVRNTNPVKGIDGAAALQAQQKYEKSFKQSVGADPGAPMVQTR